MHFLFKIKLKNAKIPIKFKYADGLLVIAQRIKRNAIQFQKAQMEIRNPHLRAELQQLLNVHQNSESPSSLKLQLFTLL